ncbi:hypothetical protein J6590_000099 [Homalodisca vitripennis]|nr:hypothetical protein J6590_000099 [Homalodisca vitripennis]
MSIDVHSDFSCKPNIQNQVSCDDETVLAETGESAVGITLFGSDKAEKFEPETLYDSHVATHVGVELERQKFANFIQTFSPQRLADTDLTFIYVSEASKQQDELFLEPREEEMLNRRWYNATSGLSLGSLFTYRQIKFPPHSSRPAK